MQEKQNFYCWGGSWDIEKENIQWKVQSEGGEEMPQWREGEEKGFHQTMW